MSAKPQSTEKQEERLSQLIQLKRGEKPDSEFWESFEEDLRSKQLSALVGTQAWYERIGKLAFLMARKSVVAIAVSAAAALTFLAINPNLFFAPNAHPSSADLPMAELASENPSKEVPLFLVGSSMVADTNAPDRIRTPRFDGQATYVVNILSAQKSSNKYELVAYPKTLIANDINSQFVFDPHATGSGFGAKIIRAKTEF